jgi:hypothetical protein
VAVELATAYVSLTVTAKGIASDLNRELGAPLQNAADSAGKKSGAGFKSGFGGALNQLKTEATGASGFLNEVGSSGSKVGGILKQNLAAGAVAAGAALGAFAVKAAGAFQDAALDAGKFAAATGITVDQASRLREVAGDYDVSAGAVEGALLKFNKSAEDAAPKLKALGAELVYTKEGAVDSYASFINAATAIGGIEDPTKRAQAAQEVFGRSYGEIAELMELDAGGLRTALDDVSDAKVIDQQELETARDFRARLDELKDTGEDLVLGFGKLVVSLGPLITGIAKGAQAVIGFTGSVADFVFGTKALDTEAANVVSSLGSLTDGELVRGFIDLGEGIRDSQSYLTQAGRGYEGFFGELSLQTRASEINFRDFKAAFDQIATESPADAERLLTSIGTLRTGTDETSLAFQEWAASVGITDETMIDLANSIPATAGAIEDVDSATTDATGAIEKWTSGQYLAAKAAIELKNEVARTDAAFAALFGNLDADRSLLNIQGGFDELKVKAEEAYTAAATGADNAEALSREYALAVIDQKDDVARYAQEVLKLPPSAVTAILAEIDAGNLEGVENLLNNAARPRVVKFTADGDIIDQRSGARAMGGPAYAGETYMVGEFGPELLTMGDRSGYVTPANETRQLLQLQPAPAGGRGGDFVLQNNRRDITLDELGRAVRMARIG